MSVTAQAQAIAQTVAQLAPKKLEAKPAETKPHAKPVRPSPYRPIPSLPRSNRFKPPKPHLPCRRFRSPTASARRDGVQITFKGAGGRASAVFVRGLTAWVVLENAPNFDWRNLKNTLGDYPAGLEAVSSNGLGILRITLKAPAQIAARGLGPDLQVEIASDVAPPPVIIGFARNQSDPRRASLSTLLPAADTAFQLLDPATGDTLTIIPAAPGRGLPGSRVFADFAALPSASGLVITPYADDLKVEVAQARVTISRPSGMLLTPPQMPVAQSPSSLARFGEGPSYLNFAKWGVATRRQRPGHRTPPDPGGGERCSRQGRHGAAESGALLSGQRLRRRGAGCDQAAADQRSGTGR